MKAIALPPSGLLRVGVVGLLCWRRRPRLGLALCAASIGGLWLLATPVFSDVLARAGEGYPALDPKHLTAAQARAQAIVILGGGVRRGAPEVGGDAPSLHADLRLIEGAKIARATQLPILISGNAREAAAMRRFVEENLQLAVRWVEAASRQPRAIPTKMRFFPRGCCARRVLLHTGSDSPVASISTSKSSRHTSACR